MKIPPVLLLFNPKYSRQIRKNLHWLSRKKPATKILGRPGVPKNTPEPIDSSIRLRHAKLHLENLLQPGHRIRLPFWVRAGANFWGPLTLVRLPHKETST